MLRIAYQLIKPQWRELHYNRQGERNRSLKVFFW